MRTQKKGQAVKELGVGESDYTGAEHRALARRRAGHAPDPGERRLRRRDALDAEGDRRGVPGEVSAGVRFGTRAGRLGLRSQRVAGASLRGRAPPRRGAHPPGLPSPVDRRSRLQHRDVDAEGGAGVAHRHADRHRLGVLPRPRFVRRRAADPAAHAGRRRGRRSQGPASAAADVAVRADDRRLHRWRCSSTSTSCASGTSSCCRRSPASPRRSAARPTSR